MKHTPSITKTHIAKSPPAPVARREIFAVVSDLTGLSPLIVFYTVYNYIIVS